MAFPTLASGLMPYDIVVSGFAGRLADEEDVMILSVLEIRCTKGDLVEIRTTCGAERVPVDRLFMIDTEDSDSRV